MQFWLGLALSVPIGIATSLVTPAIQRWIESKSKQRELTKTHRARAEYTSVMFYRRNPERFTQYLVHVAIKATLIGALVGALAGACFFVGQLVAARDATDMVNWHAVLQSIYAVGQFVGLVGSVMVVNTCRPALSLWTKLRNFDEYRATVPDDVRQTVESIEIVDGPY